MFGISRRRHTQVMDAIASTNAACNGVARVVEENNDANVAAINQIEEALDTKADMLADELMKLRKTVEELRAEGTYIKAEFSRLVGNTRQWADNQNEAVNKTLAQVATDSASRIDRMATIVETAAQALRNAR